MEWWGTAGFPARCPTEMADPPSSTPGATSPHGPGGRWGRAFRGEVQDLHHMLTLAAVLSSLLPQLAFQRLRAAIYRLAGVSIGPRTLLAGTLKLVGPGDIGSRLSIGSDGWVNGPVFIDLSGTVTIGDHVSIGHHVVIVTANHTIGPSTNRAGPMCPAPVVIGSGSWVGAGAMILPGAVIGPGCVIGAGSLVRGEIPPDSLAVGSPARVIRQLAAK
jgi:maltose O-acetyltransferase